MSVAQCRAGAARVDITPDLPCEMAGYFHSRIAERVDRPLYAAALAIESEGQRAVIVSCDLVTMTDDICMPAFEQISREYGIPMSSFIACATHTHTGPEIRRGASVPCCEGYLRKLPELIGKAIKGALDNMFDAVLAVGSMHAPGLAHNRLSRCADGSEIFGRARGGARVIGPAGPEDDAVQALAVYDLDKKLRAIAVNFACHPDCCGGGNAKAINADWPGGMSEHLMRIHGPDVVCMMLQGTAGDINQTDHRAIEKRWLPTGSDALARGVAGAALYAIEAAEPLASAGVSARRRELAVPYYTRDKALFDLVARLEAKGDEHTTYFEKNLIKRVKAWQNDGKEDHLCVSCLRIGELALVALPGEIFTNWGLEIKRYSPARHTFVIELASSHDGMTGYKPTSDQALRGARTKGAYGALPTLSQRHCPAAGQMLTEAAIEMLYELWPEQA